MADIEEVKRCLRELYGLSWFTDGQVDKLARHLVFAGVSQPLLLNYSGTCLLYTSPSPRD